MLDIQTEKSKEQLEVILSGRLDTNTAPQLEQVLQESLPGVTKVLLNFERLVYLSSAGLRVILSTQKIMNKQGEMILRKVNETIMEIFEMTGFVDILTFEEDV